MVSNIDKLFSYKVSYKGIYDQEGSNDIFLGAMKESIAHHQKNCQFFDDLLKEQKFNINDLKTINDLEKIPFIPATLFKYHEILSIKKDEVLIHATSSGTQGQKSQIFIDKSTIKLATKMAVKMMLTHKLFSLWPTNYLILGYEPKKGNNMGNVQLAQAMTRFAPSLKKVYVLRSLGDQYEIDYFGVLNALKKFNKTKLPVRIMGFPSYLYMIIQTMKKMNMKPLKLNKRSIVLTGGGWKNEVDKMINKNEYYQLIEDYLGIPKENCRDFYSAVEHSVAYPECRNHHMHVPIWSRVIIRDVENLKPLGFNEPGFLCFVSPLVSSQPLSSIMMGDIGVLRDGLDCGCGIKTPYFEVLGRAGTQKIRSCAISANEYIRGEHLE